MTPVDVFRVLIRLVHVLAAVSWIGGSIFYLLVLNPSLVGARERTADVRAAIGKRFRDLTGTCLLAVVLTGVIISVDRLAGGTSFAYGIVLAAKILFVGAMYVVYLDLGSRPGFGLLRRLTGPEALLGLGVLVFALTIVMRLVYEADLRVLIVP